MPTNNSDYGYGIASNDPASKFEKENENRQLYATLNEAVSALKAFEAQYGEELTIERIECYADGSMKVVR